MSEQKKRGRKCDGDEPKVKKSVSFDRGEIEAVRRVFPNVPLSKALGIIVKDFLSRQSGLCEK